MTKEFLFLSDATFSDAMAYAAVCYVAQQDKTNTTVLFTDAEGAYHERIRSALSDDKETVFLCSVKLSIYALEEYEMEQTDCRFLTLNEVFKALKLAPGKATATLWSLASDSSLHLPSVMAYLLFRRMGFIDFGNYVAQKLIANPSWDITRDPEVIDTLNPIL